MTDQMFEAHTLISPAKINGKWRPAGALVTVDPTSADHLRAAGAIDKNAVAGLKSEDIDTLRHKISLLEVELAEVYDQRTEEKSTAAARILELEGERDRARQESLDANQRAEAISKQAEADHSAAVDRIAELEQLLTSATTTTTDPAAIAGDADLKSKTEKPKK